MALCNNCRVTAYKPAVVALCLALAAARVLGLHAHLHAADHDEPTGLFSIMAEHDHAMDHSLHDAVDVDITAVGADRISLPQTTFVLWACVLAALLVAAAVSSKSALPPPFRPPKVRSRRFLSPPSQAPPHFA